MIRPTFSGLVNADFLPKKVQEDLSSSYNVQHLDQNSVDVSLQRDKDRVDISLTEKNSGGQAVSEIHNSDVHQAIHWKNTDAIHQAIERLYETLGSRRILSMYWPEQVST